MLPPPRRGRWHLNTSTHTSSLSFCCLQITAAPRFTSSQHHHPPLLLLLLLFLFTLVIAIPLKLICSSHLLLLFSQGHTKLPSLGLFFSCSIHFCTVPLMPPFSGWTHPPLSSLPLTSPAVQQKQSWSCFSCCILHFLLYYLNIEISPMQCADMWELIFLLFVPLPLYHHSLLFFIPV